MFERALELITLLGGHTPLRGLHTIAFGVAVTTVIYGHILLRAPDKPLTDDQAHQIHTVTTVTAWTLAVLVLTGFWLMIMGVRADPYYLDNEKLLAKVGIVTFACANGAYLHWTVFPKMQPGVVLSELPLAFQVKAALAAAVSIAAWTWATLLGFARDWNDEATLTELGLAFGASVGIVYAVALREVSRYVIITVQPRKRLPTSPPQLEAQSAALLRQKETAPVNTQHRTNDGSPNS